MVRFSGNKLTATVAFGKQATSSELHKHGLELITIIYKTNSRRMQDSQTQHLSGTCINPMKISTQTHKTPQCHIQEIPEQLQEMLHNKLKKKKYML
jgi:hypothetical protein